MWALANQGKSAGVTSATVTLSAGLRPFVVPFVIAFVVTLAVCYAVYPVPRINVRWSEDVTPTRRVELEAVHRLAEPQSLDERTWSYGLLDTSTGNIQGLVQDPAVEDTHLIDREAFALTESRPAPLSSLFLSLVVASIIGVLVAWLVALLRQRAKQWWRRVFDAYKAAGGGEDTSLRLAERMAGSFVILVAASYFYVLMEGLFFATKPSFMSRLTMWQSFSIVVTTPLMLVGAAVPFWVAATLLLAAGRRVQPLAPLLERILFLAPAAITAAAALLLTDNFTYVLFGHSLGTVQGNGRYAYAALFSAVLLALAWSFERRSRSLFWRRHRRRAFGACGAFLGVSVLAAFGNAASPPAGPEISLQDERADRANILILSTDGLNADHMSAYGYERDTTPFIEGILPQLLVSENHLSNNESTAGSIASLLTGKLSTATRVLSSPDAFVGDDVYEHLPGLLRGWGYSNVDVGLRFFADTHDMNMRQAFQVGVGRRLESPGALEPLRARLTSEFYFFDLLKDRIDSRLRHAFGVEDTVNPVYAQNLTEETSDDSPRIEEWRRFLDASPRPFFAHLHLLGTHGGRFYPQRRQFSLGSNQADLWMTDFYDDAILQFDGYVAEAVQVLKDAGDYENTLIIINSDHGSQWTIDQRLPLLFRFPRQEYRGHIVWNTQRVDIAPTIVDYLGGEIPSWMAGRSLIRSEPDTRRPILSFVSKDSQGDSGEPPFYNLQAVQLALGDRLYRLELSTAEIHTMRLGGHTAPLEEGELPLIGEVRQAMVRHLREAGYDVSSLEAR